MKRALESLHKQLAMRKFHLPSPESRKVSRDQAISEFAKDFAGTEYDLDDELETAGAEHLAGSLRVK